MSDLRQQLEGLRLDDNQVGRRRWGLWLTVAIVLLAVGLFAWRSRTAWAAVEVSTTRPSVEAVAANGQDSPVLTASGYVVARRKAVVSAKIQGRLQQLTVEEGSRVKQGAVLARLESTDLEAQIARSKARAVGVRTRISRSGAAIARAEADLAEARRQFTLRDKLVAERVVSTDERDAAASRVTIAETSLAQARGDQEQAVADLGEAEADVRVSEALLQNTVIRAPFDGTVVKKMAEVGESVAPIPPGVNISTASGAIVALADLDTLEAEVDVAEANVGKLEPEQPAEVIVEAFPDRRYRAVLRQVIPTADRTKATVLVKVTILDRDEKLKPEMSARVTFLEFARKGGAPAPAPRVLLLQSAVVSRDGRMQVFEVIEGRVKARAVTVGQTFRDRVAITEGLTGGETVVANPPTDLKDGAAVTVKP